MTAGVLKVLISYAQCLVRSSASSRALATHLRRHGGARPTQPRVLLDAAARVPTGGRLGFFTELAFWMSVPLLSLAGVLLIAAAMWATRKGCGEPADASSDGWRGLLTALNHPRVYKVLTWTMLLIYPSLARKSLATFDCLAAGLDASGAPVVLLRDDPVEPCYVGAWIGWAVVAGVGVAVYCLGLPLIALLLARGEHLRTAEDAAASERAALLVNNYEPDFWYCEAVLLLHKLAFTGVIHLIAPETRLQLWCGMLGSLLTFILYLQARPFKHAIVDNVQAAALLQILFTYISAFLFFSDGGEEFHDEVWLGAVLTAVNSVCFVVLLVTVVASAYRARRRAMRTRLHFLDTGEPVTARKLPPQLEYHLFLSHQWGTGQDQMRVTKSRLLEMMPDVQIFLDVDVKGLRLGDLESYVRASEVVLCFCSQGYFSSRNCLRELRAAVRLDKPLLALLETDESKGGMSVEQIRTQLMEADELMLKWFGSADAEALSGARLADALLAREPIEFNRLGPFQDVTMRMIASELLSEPRRIYLRAERLRPPKLGPPRGKDKRFHLFVSAYNRGCKRLVDEVEDFLSGRHSTQAARVCVDVSSQRVQQRRPVGCPRCRLLHTRAAAAAPQHAGRALVRWCHRNTTS